MAASTFAGTINKQPGDFQGAREILFSLDFGFGDGLFFLLGPDHMTTSRGTGHLLAAAAFLQHPGLSSCLNTGLGFRS